MEYEFNVGEVDHGTYHGEVVWVDELVESLKSLRKDFLNGKRGYHVTIQKWIDELESR